jgi:hypothetical protein
MKFTIQILIDIKIMELIIPIFPIEIDVNIIININDMDTLSKLYFICSDRFAKILDDKLIRDQIADRFKISYKYKNFKELNIFYIKRKHFMQKYRELQKSYEQKCLQNFNTYITNETYDEIH